MANKKATLRALCGQYLDRLEYMAEKRGLGNWLREMKRANKNGECEPTEKEVNMLSRLVDDERVGRKDIPEIVGKSYRQCCDDGTFDRIKTLKRVGIYSKVSALLHKD